MKINKDLIIALVSFLFILLLVFLGYNYFFKESEVPVNEEVNVDNIDGFGSTPQESLTKFILINGTIGDYTDVTAEKLRNKTASQNNNTRRYEAYTLASEGIAVDSDLLSSTKMQDIRDYTETMQWATYYTIDKNSIKTSKPSEPYDLPSILNSNKIYKAVDVIASFNSTQTYFRLKSTDAESDGSYIQINNAETFDNIRFTLVEVEDNNWKIYSINDEDDSNIGPRFSTWDTNKDDLTKVENDTEIREIKTE